MIESSDLRTALALHQAGQLDRAAAIYRQVLARNPDDAYALHYLGLLEAGAGRFESREHHRFDEALAAL
jgi:protein O-GlcNAc transferase